VAVGRPITYRATECPQCGSVLSRVKQAGYTEPPESYRIRARRCMDCGLAYSTVEVAIPLETTYYRLDPTYREQRRRREWDRFGYTTEHHERRVQSDRIEVQVTVKPWRKRVR
jgi:transcriptional regulator NrdR family protein